MEIHFYTLEGEKFKLNLLATPRIDELILCNNKKYNVKEVYHEEGKITIRLSRWKTDADIPEF